MLAFKQLCALVPRAVEHAAQRSDDELTRMCDNKYEEGVLSGLLSADEINVHWCNIGGLAQTKELLREFTVYPLKYPELYASGTAASAPKGSSKKAS